MSPACRHKLCRSRTMCIKSLSRRRVDIKSGLFLFYVRVTRRPLVLLLTYGIKELTLSSLISAEGNFGRAGWKLNLNKLVSKGKQDCLIVASCWKKTKKNLSPNIRIQTVEQYIVMMLIFSNFLAYMPTKPDHYSTFYQIKCYKIRWYNEASECCQ